LERDDDLDDQLPVLPDHGFHALKWNKDGNFQKVFASLWNLLLWML
jgi:hypothetical protein